MTSWAMHEDRKRFPHYISRSQLFECFQSTWTARSQPRGQKRCLKKHKNMLAGDQQMKEGSDNNDNFYYGDIDKLIKY